MRQLPDTRLREVVVTITGVDIDENRLMVRDSMGNEFVVDAATRPKGGMPQIEERWLLTRRGSRWVIDSQIGAPPILRIVGDRLGLHPIMGQMLDALAQQGLVVDNTTGVTYPTVYDDTNDPPPEQSIPDDPDYTGEVPHDPVEEPDPDPEAIPPNHNGPGKDDDKDRDDGWETLFFGSINLPHTQGNIRVRNDLFRFGDSRVDVFGTQEFWPPERAEMIDEFLDRGWNGYRPNGHAAENTIFWREGMFEKMDDFTIQLTPPNPVGAGPSRYLSGVKLRHKEAQRTFWFMNTHFDPLGLIGYNPARQYEQTRKVALEMQQRGKHFPVITSGDFNVNYVRDLRERNPQYPYAKFRSVQTFSNWSMLRHRPDRGTKGGAIIDYLWFTRPHEYGIRVKDHWILTGYNTDHRPVLVKTEIRSQSGPRRRR